MPRRRNSRASREAVVYVNVPTATLDVTIEVLESATVELQTPEKITDVTECVQLVQASGDFDGIELHGNEFQISKSNNVLCSMYYWWIAKF